MSSSSLVAHRRVAIFIWHFHDNGFPSRV